MTIDETVAALLWLKVETGSLACLGCGHEHNCSTHGCAIINAAIEQIKISSAPASVLHKGDAETLTWVRSLDGHTDIGLRRGVTIDEAIWRLAELEGTLSESGGGGKIEAGILQGVPRHDLVGDNTAR